MRVIFQGASKGSLLKDHKQMPDEQKGLIYTENHDAILENLFSALV